MRAESRADNSNFLPDRRCVSAQETQRQSATNHHNSTRSDVHSCNSTDALSSQDEFWVASAPQDEVGHRASESGQTEFTITELAQEFGLTHRALRFYDTRGLLSPQRVGRRRVFTPADRDRLAVIVQGKKLGFTLAEISQMIEAQSGRANAHALKLTAEKCLEQIAFFERQMREAGEALAELRRIHLSVCVQAGQQGKL
jgi:DNA-binding transcriptional MerR regulator